ncbi:hypothetical protein DSECCO2_388060 [anaerobic digester metagenome]
MRSKMCQVGRMDTQTSSDCSLMSGGSVRTLCMMLEWVSMTPLGVPVVPEV